MEGINGNTINAWFVRFVVSARVTDPTVFHPVVQIGIRECYAVVVLEIPVVLNAELAEHVLGKMAILQVNL